MDDRLEAGHGGRPLLLLHGFTGAKEDFADHLDALGAKGWHAVAPDLPGHGGGPKPDDEQAYSFDAYVRFVLDLADSLGWRRFALLGHSMGGMVAQCLALTAPERLDALVLMDTTHGPLPDVDPALVELGVLLARTEGMPALLAASKLHDDPLATEAFDRLCAERPGHAEFCDRKVLASSPAMWAAMVQAMLAQTDRLEALRALAVPTLVLVGEHDRGFRTASRRMAEAIPGARFEVIDGAGHSPQFERPDAWWRALTSFLDAVVAAEAVG